MVVTNVAFLQQHHIPPWYHFTHYGVYNWLINSGFDNKQFMINAAQMLLRSMDLLKIFL